jgi:cation transport protein ChaC
MWVFGYGSLMWHPDFPHAGSAPALLHGYHRSLCVYSTRYRGTPDRPGLVLGLDRGGSCRGRVFRVAATDAEAVRDYLWEREMNGYAYLPKWLTVQAAQGPVTAKGSVTALAFVVDRARSPDYAGRLDDERLVEHILGGRGHRGSSLDYLASTVRHLDELGIREGELHRLLDLARRRAAG